jgi:hypothetical protein
MSKLILDATLRSKLNGLNEQMEVCDETGQTVGFFLPKHVLFELQRLADGCPYSWEELERHSKQTGGCSLEEIWQRLGAQ